MKLYQGTGCHIVLIGVLTEPAQLLMNKLGDLQAHFEVEIKIDGEAKQYFDVVVQDDVALKIKRYGFVGLYLLIEGSFLGESTVSADKVTFLNSVEPVPAILQLSSVARYQSQPMLH